MREYPLSDYSHNDIERAGMVIAGDTAFSGDVTPQYLVNAFRIAENWRAAHAYPMRSIHQSLRAHLRNNDLEGITAARLKRMPAIRRKLRRIRLGLDQIQDLGGCRVILSSIADTRALVEVVRQKLPSIITKENDYIAEPKKDGYRSHHLILGFRRPEPTNFDDKRIELQVRTRLQHSWATAVEAVGLFRGEELKNQQGDKDWLRLFCLMSAEFAEAEQCAIVPGVPEATSERKLEIKNLAARLDAIIMLESVSNGVKGADIPSEPGSKPSHYLIRYDRDKKIVHVDPYYKVRYATVSYDKAEEAIREIRAEHDQDVVVLVEVDKIENLKIAYPNYFGDVGIFTEQLRNITLGHSAVEFSRLPKQPSKPWRQETGIGPSWLRGTHFQRPSLKRKKKPKRRR